ncbi:MAG: hypothetical protein A4E73_03830 [Syntrophaceae bacterium PtaU1.Bin231]|nr:MAG: hypothetical protein A4E73_03830 [Syntrophaceae bacterium PtaU1.Bin231]
MHAFQAEVGLEGPTIFPNLVTLPRPWRCAAGALGEELVPPEFRNEVRAEARRLSQNPPLLRLAILSLRRADSSLRCSTYGNQYVSAARSSFAPARFGLPALETGWILRQPPSSAPTAPLGKTWSEGRGGGVDNDLSLGPNFQRCHDRLRDVPFAAPEAIESPGKNAIFLAHTQGDP